MTKILKNKNAIGSQLSSRQYRQVLREFFAQSNTFIVGLRNANPHIHVTLPTNQQGQNQNQQEDDIEDDKDDIDDEYDADIDQSEETSRASREIKELVDITGV